MSRSSRNIRLGQSNFEPKRGEPLRSSSLLIESKESSQSRTAEPRMPSPLPILQPFSSSSSNSNGTLSGRSSATLKNVTSSSITSTETSTSLPGGAILQPSRGGSGKLNKLMQLAQDDHEIIEALKRKNAELQSQVNGRMDSVESIQRNFENLSKLYMQEKGRADHMEQKAKISAERIGELEDQLRQMESYVEDLNRLKLLHTNLQSKYDDAEALLNEKSNQNMRLQQKIEMLLSDANNYKQHISQSEERLLQSTEKQRLLEDEVKVLKIRQKETLGELSQAQNLIEDLKAQLEAKSQTLSNLQDEVKIYQTSSSETKDLEQQLTSLKRERLVMSQSLQNYESSLKELQDREKELQSTLKREKRDRQMVETDLNMINQRFAQSKEAQRTLEHQLDEEKRRSGEEIDSLERQLSSTLEQNATLKDQNASILTMLQTSSRKVVHLEGEINDLQNDNKSLKSVLEDRLESLESLKKQLRDHQVEARKWKTHFDTANLKNASSDDLISKYKKIEATHKKQIKHLEQGNAQLLGKNKDLADQLHSAQKEIQDLLKSEGEKVVALQEKIQELEIDVEEYKKQISLATADLQTLENERSEILDDLNMCQERAMRLEKEIKDVQAVKEGLDSEVKELHKVKVQKIHLEGEVAELNIKLRQLMSEVQQHRQLEKEMELLIKEKRDLIDRIHVVEEKYKKELSDAEQRWSKEREALLSEPILQKLQTREKQLQSTIEKLLKNEKASSAALTCMRCMELFKDPVVCVPCGHSFCRECLVYTRGAHTACPECSEGIQNVAPSEILDILAGKCEYRKQTLESLVNLASKGLVPRN